MYLPWCKQAGSLCRCKEKCTIAQRWTSWQTLNLRHCFSYFHFTVLTMLCHFTSTGSSSTVNKFYLEKNLFPFYKNDASFILAYHSIQATKSKSRKANEKLGLFFNRCHLLTYTGFQFAFRIMRPSRKCNLFRLLWK